MTHLLDDPATYALDGSDMFGHIERLGPELERAWLQSARMPAPARAFDRMVIAAMGGSAAAGDYFAGLASKKSPFPVDVVRGYDLPRHVGASSLVVVLSYSGETEEALSCYEQAGERGASRMAISTGGELARRAADDGVPSHEIDYDSPPRAALPHALAALLRLGDMTGAIALCDADLFAATRAHSELVSRHIGRHVSTEANAAKQLAELLAPEEKVVIFAAEHLAAAGLRTRNQFAENAKVTSLFEEVPEATHNVIVGFEREGSAPTAVGFSAPAVRDSNKRRMEVLSQFLERNGGAMATLQMRGISRLADLLEATAWGDYLSCYVALLRGVDPTPTMSLSEMRAAVAQIPATNA